MEINNKKWFESWFDTEYYHLLYKHRNDLEAKEFIKNLIQFLDLKFNAHVFDLACGKGRHSLELHSHGLNVLGLDLSSASIAHAIQFQQVGLDFQVHDMRNSFGDGQFDAGFNLFTSFGYFDNEQEDIRALSNAYKALNSGGYFIQDYINAQPILPLLPQKGEKIDTLGNRTIEFKWLKHLESGIIVKEIEVTDSSNQFHFQERVQVYSVNELKELHQKAGFEVLHVFGNYELGPFDSQNSPRIILISRKLEV